MKSKYKNYLISTIESPDLLDGVVYPEYISFYKFDINGHRAHYYNIVNSIKSWKKSTYHFGLYFLYVHQNKNTLKRYRDKMLKSSTGFWIRHADWRDKIAPITAFIYRIRFYK